MFVHPLLVMHTGHVYYERKGIVGRVTANYFRGVSNVLYLGIEKLRYSEPFRGKAYTVKVIFKH
jgi:hypothetical protein